MTLTRIFPVSESHRWSTDAGEDALASEIGPLYAPLPGATVRINMIASVDGSATGSDGTSNTLTSRVDRVLLRVIRSFADVVVVGAASVRREGYRMPRTARLAVVTTSGDLDGHRIAAAPGAAPVLVLCPERAVARIRESLGEVEAEVVVLPDVGGRFGMSDAIAALAARSLVRVLCEGGPTIAAQLVDAGLVDELCLTTAPVLAGGATLIGDMTGSRPLRLTQLLVDDAGFQFARWSFSDRDAGEPVSIL